MFAPDRRIQVLLDLTMKEPSA